MNLTILNDLHIGTVRVAGTTPASALALRDYLLEQMDQQLGNIDTDLLILGDLFDKEFVPLRDVLTTFSLLSSWLRKGHKLWLVPGNHDLSKNSATFSSFQFLASLLTSMNAAQVTTVNDLTEIYPSYWVLPHVANQDLLNERLAKVPECQALFVHTNYDNGFAAESDHSLNISREQALECKATYIVFAHEHQTREALEGKVLIPGNQIPSSVADCLGCDGVKKMIVFMAGVPRMTETMTLPFAEMDWKALESSEAKFIRVSGKATAEQGAEVAQAISKYRAQSKALVITNAVKMLQSDDQLEEFAQSLESVSAFDVMAALKELLTPEEVKAVEELP